MTATELTANEESPMKTMVNADKRSPTVKNLRASERSETLPITNLLIP